MKKTFCVLCILFIICGCGQTMGSFKDGNMNMEKLYAQLEEHIASGTWNLGLMDESFWSKRRVEKVYQLDLTQIEECYVKSSIVEAEISEIAFFKVSKKNEPYVKKAIEVRLHTLEKKWGHYIANTNIKLKKVAQGRIGKYYYMILGDDNQKVVNYIRDYE